MIVNKQYSIRLEQADIQAAILAYIASQNPALPILVAPTYTISNWTVTVSAGIPDAPADPTNQTSKVVAK